MSSSVSPLSSSQKKYNTNKNNQINNNNPNERKADEQLSFTPRNMNINNNSHMEINSCKCDLIIKLF